MKNEKTYKGAVFFDLDGTLLDNVTDHVPDSAKRALEQLKQNGWLVCLSTGRDMDTHYSVKYLEEVRPDAVIHSNGYKITAGNQLLFTHHFNKQLVKKLIEYAKREGYCVGTSIGEADYYLNPDLKLEADRKWNKTIVRHFHPVSELFEQDIDVLAMTFAGLNTYEIQKKVEEEFPEITLFPFNRGTGADVVENGFSKAEGIERICAHFDIDLRNTYAFGDSPNDLPMFKKAAVGIAMGNASDEVKQQADMVTDSVDRDGIVNALVKIGLI